MEVQLIGCNDKSYFLLRPLRSLRVSFLIAKP